MDAEKPRTPKPWIDVTAHLPQLESKPFLVAAARAEELAEVLPGLGFRLVRVELPHGVADPEETLLVELTRALEFSPLGAGSWAAYSDRLWDLQTEAEEMPVAILISGLDRLVRSNIHGLLRCVHNLLSMTEAVGLSDPGADLQVEYFFIGAWSD